MFTRHRFLATAFCVAIFSMLAGCATSTSVEETIASEPTLEVPPTTSIPPTPMATPTDTPAPAVTATPTPTNTPAPTATLTYTPTATATALLTHAPTNTPMPSEDEIVSGPSGPSGEDHDSAFRSLTVHPHNPDIILMGTERNGFVLSNDGGTTWSRKRNGLRHWYGSYPEVWDIAFDPVNPSNIYAATLDSPGPITGNYPSASAGVYKSGDGGDNWSQMNGGLWNSRITSVQVSASNPDTVVIGVEGGTVTFSELQGQYFDGGIYRSTGGGANWSKVTIGENDVRNGYWRIVAYGDSGDQFTTFGLNYSNTSENMGFLRSTDSGASWEMFGNPLRSLLLNSFDVSKDGQVIYANERDSYVIQKSTDGGASWHTTSINQANGPIAVSPVDSQLVLYAGASTLYRSADGLEPAQAVLKADATISDIVFAPSAPNIVYAVADGYLLYKSTNAGATFEFLINIRADVLNK